MRFAPFETVAHLVDRTWVGRRIIGGPFRFSEFIATPDGPDEVETGKTLLIHEHSEHGAATITQIDYGRDHHDLPGVRVAYWVATTPSELCGVWIAHGTSETTEFAVEVSDEEWATRRMNADEAASVDGPADETGTPARSDRRDFDWAAACRRILASVDGQLDAVEHDIAFAGSRQAADPERATILSGYWDRLNAANEARRTTLGRTRAKIASIIEESQLR